MLRTLFRYKGHDENYHSNRDQHYTPGTHNFLLSLILIVCEHIVEQFANFIFFIQLCLVTDITQLAPVEPETVAPAASIDEQNGSRRTHFDLLHFLIADRTGSYWFIGFRLDFKRVEELFGLLKKAYKTFYRRPGYMIRRAFKVKSIKDFKRKSRVGVKLLKEISQD